MDQPKPRRNENGRACRKNPIYSAARTLFALLQRIPVAGILCCALIMFVAALASLAWALDGAHARLQRQANVELVASEPHDATQTDASSDAQEAALTGADIGQIDVSGLKDEQASGSNDTDDEGASKSTPKNKKAKSKAADKNKSKSQDENNSPQVLPKTQDDKESQSLVRYRSVHHTAYYRSPVYRRIHHVASKVKRVKLNGSIRVIKTSCPACGGHHAKSYTQRIIDHYKEHVCRACGGKHRHSYTKRVRVK